jgi:hypothetical protein
VVWMTVSFFFGHDLSRAGKRAESPGLTEKAGLVPSFAFQEGSAEPQVPPLRFAPVGMTKKE